MLRNNKKVPPPSLCLTCQVSVQRERGTEACQAVPSSVSMESLRAVRAGLISANHSIILVSLCPTDSRLRLLTGYRLYNKSNAEVGCCFKPLITPWTRSRAHRLNDTGAPHSASRDSRMHEKLSQLHLDASSVLSFPRLYCPGWSGICPQSSVVDLRGGHPIV